MIGNYAYWSFPQVAETNTPQPMDMAGGVFVVRLSKLYSCF